MSHPAITTIDLEVDVEDSVKLPGILSVKEQDTLKLAKPPPGTPEKYWPEYYKIAYRKREKRNAAVLEAHFKRQRKLKAQARKELFLQKEEIEKASKDFEEYHFFTLVLKSLPLF